MYGLSDGQFSAWACQTPMAVFFIPATALLWNPGLPHRNARCKPIFLKSACTLLTDIYIRYIIIISNYSVFVFFCVIKQILSCRRCSSSGFLFLMVFSIRVSLSNPSFVKNWITIITVMKYFLCNFNRSLNSTFYTDFLLCNVQSRMHLCASLCMIVQFQKVFSKKGKAAQKQTGFLRYKVKQCFLAACHFNI